MVGLLAFSLATLPLWGLAAGAVDLGARGRRSALRCAGFLLWYLACEGVGLLAIAAVNVARLGGRDAFLDANRRLQDRFAQALFAGARWIFGVHLVVEGGEAFGGGPVLVLIRHASVVDTLIPTLAASIPYGLRLRYVLKSELLWDPCLDIVGNRMGHYFVRRGSGDPDREVAGVVALAQGLGPHDGVLIYPEGTRFSPAKRERVLAKLEQEGDRDGLARALALRHVLPPRTQGTLGLLDAAPEADVVVCAHTGLESTTSFWDLWTGATVGRTLRARCWRIPRAEIPRRREERVTWLYDQWQRVDDWIEASS